MQLMLLDNKIKTLWLLILRILIFNFSFLIDKSSDQNSDEKDYDNNDADCLKKYYYLLLPLIFTYENSKCII